MTEREKKLRFIQLFLLIFSLLILYLTYYDKSDDKDQEIISKSIKEKVDLQNENSLSDNNDVFFKPVDIGDNTIPNGNAVMLINLIRLGMIDEAKKLADSLNGYLNIYKNHMMTSLRAIDYFNNIKKGKNCNEQGCKIDV